MKTICLFIGVFYFLKLIFIGFLSPQIDGYTYHIIGIIMSWTLFWVDYDVILMNLNQLVWMLYLF